MPQDFGAINPEDRKTTISPSVRAGALPAASRYRRNRRYAGLSVSSR